MKVAVLGPLEVMDGPVRVDVGGARLRTLLVRLALAAGDGVRSESLAADLWGDDQPSDQANALQSLVSRLRRLLPDPAAITSTGGGYRLEISPDDVDALRFERLARRGRAALERGVAADAAELLAEALTLWRGAALVDAGEVPFVQSAAARLEELRLSALEDRLDADLALGRHLAVVAEVEALALQHPLRERLSASLVRALYAAGRQSEAHARYEETRQVLADELGVDPGPQLQAAHLAILRGEGPPQATAADPLATAVGRTNLRAQLTSFVGREDDVERISARLQASRLVTLVGPGGAGKTRLASEVGAVLAPSVRHGVWLAELASVTDPDDLAQAVLGSLGLRESNLLDSRRLGSPRDALDRLLDSLVDKDALIILDNCEHLVEAVARLADQLLAHCADLRVLATSREPLAILGEAILPVQPLGQPQPTSPPAVALASAAVRLFADRAGAVQPGFVVDDENVEAVTEICRRLDGLPLAIELAAARLRSMPVELVAARLDDRFRLLTGGSRAAVPRHRTLRAVVEWSWDLLDGPERVLAERVAVFPAGATAEGAEAVCAGVVPADLVPDLLAALVDKSLLVLEAGPRYRMLETVREYGVERLADRGELAGVRAMHAAYFLDLAERADPHLRTGGQLPWIAELMAERDNLLAALRLAVDVEDAGTAVRLGAALGWFWTLRGLDAEASTWLGLALSVPGEAPAEPRMIAGTIYGMSALMSAEHERGLQVLKEVAQTQASTGLVSSHPMIGMAAAGVAMFNDDYPGALAVIEAALARAGSDPWSQAALCMMRAFVAENAGDVGTMRSSLTEAMDGFAAMGERWGLGTTLSALGTLRMTDGDLDGALEAFERSLTMMRELGSSDDAAHILIRMSMVRARQGDVAKARAELHAIMAVKADEGSLVWSSFAAVALADLARHDRDDVEARRLVVQALADLERVTFAPSQVKAVALVTLALVELGASQVALARELLGQACHEALGARDMPVIAVVAGGVAVLLRAEGAAESSALLLGAVTALRGSEEVGNADVEQLAALLRTDLGMDGYDAAYRRGVALPTQEALALLRSSVGTPGPPAERTPSG